MYEGKQKYEWDRTAKIVWSIFVSATHGKTKLTIEELNPFRQKSKKKKHREVSEDKLVVKENWEMFKGMFSKEKNGT